MDGKGRATDNIFTERFWKTIKYENDFIRRYESKIEARTGLTEYIDSYNDERIHASLSYRTPSNFYSNARDVACITVETYPLNKAA